MISGVKIIANPCFADNRGFLIEAVKKSQLPDFEFRQMNFTVSHPGVIKAFHWHKKQIDLWFCVGGNLEAVLFDRRDDSPTAGEIQTEILGEHRKVALFIPVGVAHGYRVLGEKSASLVYLVNQEYNPQDPDEQRIPFDDEKIGFDWTTKPR
jgi:dTDP-4-dehydrorhamnose 3,5-epimerase